MDEDAEVMSEPVVGYSLWTCFTCEYRGPADYDPDDPDDEARCPECGTVEGDGFGMAESDPREQ